MSLEYLIKERAYNQCELCKNNEDLEIIPVSPKSGEITDDVAVLCKICRKAISDNDYSDQNHWRCLNESIWSTVPAVQVLSYRILKSLSLAWANDTLEMAYLDEDITSWANETDEKIIHLDSNGNILENGDTVTLIQDLNVKGASFTAKRGTAVRRIRLVHDNPEYIEGKVADQQIVILTKYVKKG